MVERKVKVAIPCGIHIRPAGIISHTANSFKADSRIVFGYHVINTASILNLVASGIHCGDIVRVECEGPDEQAAMDGIATVLQDTTIKQ